MTNEKESINYNLRESYLTEGNMYIPPISSLVLMRLSNTPSPQRHQDNKKSEVTQIDSFNNQLTIDPEELAAKLEKVKKENEMKGIKAIKRKSCERNRAQSNNIGKHPRIS